MIAILSLILVLLMSLVIVRIATVALTLTGLSKDLARFQARSAFTGAGFTTNESEKVVGHPVRRRIIMLLMVLGNAGIVTAMSSLILSFTNVPQNGGWTGSVWFRLSLLVVGVLGLFILAQSRYIDRWMSRLIAWALKNWTTLEVRDYAGLLHLGGDYAVSELFVEEEDWLANRQLAELRLNQEGVLVLGISRRDGKYVGAPRGKTRIKPYDTLLIYGRGKVLEDLDQRRAGSEGSMKHIQSVAEQMTVERTEQADEPPLDDDQDAAT